MLKAKLRIFCPICGEKNKDMKAGDKDQGGEATCKWCDEKFSMPKILIIEPVKEVVEGLDE